jgi:transcription antitermination factor NusA-like protein
VIDIKTPLCSDCAWKTTLCPTCQQKLEGGHISSLDIEISKILYKINESYNISEASFERAVDFGNVTIIFTEGEVGFLIGRKGKVVSSISSALGKKVRIVQTGKDVKKSIEDMLAPAKLIGLNSFFSEGKEKVKVRISSKSDKLAVGEDVLQAVISDWLKKDVQIVLEPVQNSKPSLYKN